MAEAVSLFPFSGTHDYTATLAATASDFVIYNDGADELTFTAGAFTSRLMPGDAFDERLSPFTDISVTATDAYHGWVRVVNRSIG